MLKTAEELLGPYVWGRFFEIGKKICLENFIVKKVLFSQFLPGMTFWFYQTHSPLEEWRTHVLCSGEFCESHSNLNLMICIDANVRYRIQIVKAYCLTFVTPSLLVGDRSLVNVIAHEIAHSWTGNLVTNANWQHFWCVYLYICLSYG